MRYVPSGKIEITSPRRIRLPGVKAYQSNLILPHHVEQHRVLGWPVSTAPRIACEVAVRLGDDTLKKVLDAARRDRLLTYDEVWEVLQELKSPGRRRTTAIERVLSKRISGFEQDESDGEQMLLGWLLDGGVSGLVQQHWVVVNGMRYRCDLAIPHQRIDIEWDAFATHGQDRGAFDYDKLRDDDFDAAGWHVIRVTNAWSPARAVAAVKRAARRAA
jgi:very-short-patch-repair endonuclease